MKHYIVVLNLPNTQSKIFCDQKPALPVHKLPCPMLNVHYTNIKNKNKKHYGACGPHLVQLYKVFMNLLVLTSNAYCCRVGAGDMIAAAQGDAAQFKKVHVVSI